MGPQSRRTSPVVTFSSPHGGAQPRRRPDRAASRRPSETTNGLFARSSRRESVPTRQSCLLTAPPPASWRLHALRSHAFRRPRAQVEPPAAIRRRNSSLPPVRTCTLTRGSCDGKPSTAATSTAVTASDHPMVSAPGSPGEQPLRNLRAPRCPEAQIGLLMNACRRASPYLALVRANSLNFEFVKDLICRLRADCTTKHLSAARVKLCSSARWPRRTNCRTTHQSYVCIVSSMSSTNRYEYQADA